jgi:hypothetical protein
LHFIYIMDKMQGHLRRWVSCVLSPAKPGGLHLRAWFEQMPVAQWKATLEAIADSEGVTQRLRMHTRTGRPLGDDTFLSTLDTLLGCRVRPLPRGRIHPLVLLIECAWGSV